MGGRRGVQEVEEGGGEGVEGGGAGLGHCGEGWSEFEID